MSLLKKGEAKRRDRPRAKGPGAVFGLILILASMFGAAYFYLDWARSGQAKRISGLESLSARLRSETVPLRFMVLSRDEEGIRARVRLYDLAGEELVLIEKDFPGRELYFDFLVSPLPNEGGDRWLAFPYRIFTDALPAAEGVLLCDSYDRSGFPAIFDGAAEDGATFGPEDRKALSAVYARARKAAKGELDAVDPAKPRRSSDYGSAVHDVSALSRFEVGAVYKIVCRIKGGIEIMED